MNYVYVLQSVKSKRLYIGRCADLKKRIEQHKQGKTWTTKRMLPVELIFYEAFKSKLDCIRREQYLKTSKGKSTIRQMLREGLR